MVRVCYVVGLLWGLSVRGRESSRGDNLSEGSMALELRQRSSRRLEDNTGLWAQRGRRRPRDPRPTLGSRNAPCLVAASAALSFLLWARVAFVTLFPGIAARVGIEAESMLVYAIESALERELEKIPTGGLGPTILNAGLWLAAFGIAVFGGISVCRACKQNARRAWAFAVGGVVAAYLTWPDPFNPG